MRAEKRTPSLRARAVLVATCVVCLLAWLAYRNRSEVSHQELWRISNSSVNHIRPEGELPEEEFVWLSDTQDWALIHQAVDPGSVAPGPQVGCVWPDERPEKQCTSGDRIVNQLLLSESHGDKSFKIAWANERPLPLGREVFLREGCRVNSCTLTEDLEKADAIIWPNSDVPIELRSRPPSQVWIAYLLESPPNTFDRRFKRRHRGRHEFNWTASYRSDSDLVAPYSKFVPYARDGKQPSLVSQTDRRQVELNYERASERHKQLVRGKKGARVAWLVSNCHANNNRLEYARELGRFIQVDIYGKCGNLTCAKASHSACLDYLNKDYNFYLAFENSNSREYITEKLYRNGYAYNDPDHLLLPIVMGPSRRDYERLAPPKSFIHVDDFETPELLADYLRLLADDHALYYSYFQWKTMGRFIDTKFLCRTCAMLHHQSRTGKASKSYANIQEWWLKE